MQISTSLARLQSLTARGCSGVVLNGVRGFHSLRSLDLAGCDAVTPTATVRAHQLAAAEHCSPEAYCICQQLLYLGAPGI